PARDHRHPRPVQRRRAVPASVLSLAAPTSWLLKHFHRPSFAKLPIMLVSWKWLSRYVDLPMPLAELERRLALSGLNHESTISVGDDFVIDLEVTSNRGDCLGHIGVAREVAVRSEEQTSELQSR